MNRGARLVVIANIVGAALLAVGWWAASGRVTVSGQILSLNVSVAGVTLAAAADAIWLFRNHTGIRRRARRLSGAAQEAVRRLPAETVLVAVTGVSRYHRAGCLLVSGRSARPAVRTEHEGEGRQPCGVCRP